MKNGISIRTCALLACAPLLLGSAAARAAAPETIDLSRAAVVCTQDDPIAARGAEILRTEAASRTGIELPAAQGSGITIAIGTEAHLTGSDPAAAALLGKLPPTGADGFKIAFDRAGNRLLVAGHDPRGVIYGAGWLLRKSAMRPGSFLFPYPGGIAQTPAETIRGIDLNPPHPKATDPNDPQTLARFEQSIRELMVFGMNSVGVLRRVPPRYVELLKSYGLDVWLVNFYNGNVYEEEESLNRELAAREKVFKSFPAIDHLCTKSGDPGELDPATFFKVQEREVKLLKKYHPEARVWVVPQHVTRSPEEYFDEFCRRTNEADYIDGVGFGPWTRTPLPELRKKIRPELPIRRFPDIGHLYSSQYPLRNLDLPMAICYGRVAINPSPRAYKHIHNRYKDFVTGFTAYTEGTNDDVNRFVWLVQSWNPSTTAEETMADYGRFFIGPDYEKEFARGVLALEENLDGAVGPKESINGTLEIWKGMESRADAGVMSNPRFQMCLLRAYYDTYVRERYLYEKRLEKEALGILASADRKNLDGAIERARQTLRKARLEPVRPDLRQRIDELYDRIYVTENASWTHEYQKCMLQSQVDAPLNDSPWINRCLAAAQRTKSAKEKQEIVENLLHRKDPGEGGLYFDLGSLETDGIVRSGENWENDPFYLSSPFRNFGVKVNRFTITPRDFEGAAVPSEWLTQAAVYYDQPMRLTFGGLDPNAAYRVKIVYMGSFNSIRGYTVTLTAGEGTPVHGAIAPAQKPIVECSLPGGTVQPDGTVTLTWQCNRGGRGVNVAEIFFIRDDKNGK